MDFGGLPVAMVESRQGKPQGPRQIEVQRVISLQMVSPGEVYHAPWSEKLKMHSNVKAIEILERLLQLSALQHLPPLLAKQYVTHFNSPLHRHVENRAVCGGGTHRCRVGRAFRSLLKKPGERNAGVQHQLDRHQRARRSPRASARAWPAVRVLRIL